jgi:tRNA(fMet)-specific endonuclease VapC
MDRVALDTTFLIDLQNERRGRGPVQGATAFLESHLETIFFLPVVALGEYLEGFSDVACPEARALVDPLNLLEVTEDVARIYAATVRHLRAVGLLIGTNDLWIGSTARAANLPLVTRNAEHSSRIPGLQVVAYSTRPSNQP